MEAVGIIAGRLRHKIEIQAKTRTTDGQGGATTTWATITDGAVWASIQPASAREVVAYQQHQHRVTHAITMRYRAGVTSAHRVLFGTRVFNIQGIINEGERNKVLRLMVEEGVPG